MFSKVFSKEEDPNKIYFATILDAKNKFLYINSYLVAYNFSKKINQRFPKNEVNIFCGLWYSHENLKDVIKLIYVVLRNAIIFPNIKLHILCNTKKELKILRYFGIKSIYCNHNAFLDADIFTIKSGIDKIYPCVYNAVLSDFKRHELLAYINGEVALVTYGFKNVAYKNKIDKIIKKPIWLNYQRNAGAPSFLSTDEIVKIYNQSHIGLALSGIEGAMYASGEYLLCGIPIVSTESKGGRDVFFNEYNSIICAADAQDVAKSVGILLKKPIDPERIRNEMILNMEGHRKTFVDYVNSIYKEKGIDIDIRDTWNNWFVNKLRNEATLNQYIGLLEND